MIKYIIEFFGCIVVLPLVWFFGLLWDYKKVVTFSEMVKIVKDGLKDLGRS